ncbi:MAG TPA: hypothetical protein VK507_13985 [Iamia sp.]|nr:hypothetical protein [Iamia sp.]
MVAQGGAERLRPVARRREPPVASPEPVDAPIDEPTGWGHRLRAWVPWAIAVLAVALAAWAPGPTTLTPDEALWLGRSDAYGRAIDRGDLDEATSRWLDSAATMPGVTTMSAGLLGRNLANVTHAVGLSADVDPASARSPQVLRASRFVVTVWGAIALGVMVLIAGSLVGRRAATIAGLLLACEPYLLGHMGVLHTDALVTLFSCVAILAVMALRWGRRDAGDRNAGDRAGWVAISPRALVITATTFAGLALLTKLTAVVLLASGLGVVALVELVVAARAARPADRASAVGATAITLAQLVGGVALGAVALVVVLWPAIWTSPTRVWGDLRESAGISEGHVPRFFMGDATFDPGPLFLPVATVVRMSPWLLLLGGVAAVMAVAHLVAPRVDWPRRATVAGFLLAPLPYLAAVGTRPKIYDRYALPIWPFLALLVGMAAAPLLAQATERVGRPAVRIASGVALAVAALLALAPAPYRTAYASPVTGGQDGALELVPVGWGEGIEQLGRTVAERERGHCDEVLVRVRSDARVAFPCGQLSTTAELPEERTYYLVRQVPADQISLFDPGTAEEYARGEVVDDVRIGGVVFAQLWLVNPPPAVASSSAPP